MLEIFGMFVWFIFSVSALLVSTSIFIAVISTLITTIQSTERSLSERVRRLEKGAEGY